MRLTLASSFSLVIFLHFLTQQINANLTPSKTFERISILSSIRGGEQSTEKSEKKISLSELVDETIESNRKLIVVTGGVLSGIGKGVVASSLGVLLRAMKLRVTALKIDPYLNVDAGTMSPFEHGEVFVLDDGGECDLDLGNYERFLSVSLTKESNLSTGKIYQVRTIFNCEPIWNKKEE